MGEYVGEERRRKPRGEAMSEQKNGGDLGLGKLIGLVFTALVIGGAGTYVTTIQGTAQKAQQTASDLAEFKAQVAGQYALLGLKIENQNDKIQKVVEYVEREERRRARKDQ